MGKATVYSAAMIADYTGKGYWEPTTFADVWKWGQELERIHARIAPRFARSGPRRRALSYLKGIVSSVKRKNGWQLAEHAGEARPDGMQRLPGSAVWDADLVRDESLVPTS